MTVPKIYPDPAGFREKFINHELEEALKEIDRAHSTVIGSSAKAITPATITEYTLGYNGWFTYIVSAQSDLWKRFVVAMEERGFSDIEISFGSDRETYTRYTYKLKTDV